MKGGGLPNLLQYYNRGGGVYRDPKFVLRNKWTAPKRKMYTKQKGCHGVGERVGQDLELYTCISKKILSPQHRKRISDSWQCVPPRFRRALSRPRASKSNQANINLWNYTWTGWGWPSFMRWLSMEGMVARSSSGSSSSAPSLLVYVAANLR